MPLTHGGCAWRSAATHGALHSTGALRSVAALSGIVPAHAGWYDGQRHGFDVMCSTAQCGVALQEPSRNSWENYGPLVCVYLYQIAASGLSHLALQCWCQLFIHTDTQCSAGVSAPWGFSQLYRIREPLSAECQRPAVLITRPKSTYCTSRKSVFCVIAKWYLSVGSHSMLFSCIALECLFYDTELLPALCKSTYHMEK